jgi:hypothetical protein
VEVSNSVVLMWYVMWCTISGDDACSGSLSVRSRLNRGNRMDRPPPFSSCVTTANDNRKRMRDDEGQLMMHHQCKQAGLGDGVYQVGSGGVCGREGDACRVDLPHQGGPEPHVGLLPESVVGERLGQRVALLVEELGFGQQELVTEPGHALQRVSRVACCSCVESLRHLAVQATEVVYLAGGLILLVVRVPHAKQIGPKDTGSSPSSIEAAHDDQVERVRAPLEVVSLELCIRSR